MFIQSSVYLVARLIQKRILNKPRTFSTELLVLTKEVGNNATVILNRPKSLNAMTVPLQIEMLKTMKKLENHKNLVILKGAGDRAFSAGGDLLAIKKAGENKDTEYVRGMILYLNVNIYLLYKYKIPTISLMNGVTFGGGAGYSFFTKFRIATEKTSFAMPEVKVGFHINAAATYFFNRSPGKLGYYLGLTGKALTGADVFRAGYATHFCNSNNLQKLEERLLNCSNEASIKDVIEDICEKNVPEFSLTPIMDNINKCFSEHTVEGIILKLNEDGSPWAKDTLNTLNQYSPTSLKVILMQLQKGKSMDLAECLLMESNLTINFYNHPDVYEGTRIVLEDRNDTPKWNPSKLSDVTDKLVKDHFQPVGEEEQRELLKEIDDSR